MPKTAQDAGKHLRDDQAVFAVEKERERGGWQKEQEVDRLHLRLGEGGEKAEVEQQDGAAAQPHRRDGGGSKDGQQREKGKLRKNHLLIRMEKERATCYNRSRNQTRRKKSCRLKRTQSSLRRWSSSTRATARRGWWLVEEFAAQFREEYKDKDHCPCQKACRYHGNCKECVAIHRAHQGIVPTVCGRSSTPK